MIVSERTSRAEMAVLLGRRKKPSQLRRLCYPLEVLAILELLCPNRKTPHPDQDRGSLARLRDLLEGRIGLQLASRAARQTS